LCLKVNICCNDDNVDVDVNDVNVDVDVDDVNDRNCTSVKKKRLLTFFRSKS
jgi:hypothetical protein